MKFDNNKELPCKAEWWWNLANSPEYCATSSHGS